MNVPLTPYLHIPELLHFIAASKLLPWILNLHPLLIILKFCPCFLLIAQKIRSRIYTRTDKIANRTVNTIEPIGCITWTKATIVPASIPNLLYISFIQTIFTFLSSNTFDSL